MTKTTAVSGAAYQTLPEADFTPPNSVSSWSAAEKIKSFASSYGSSLNMTCLLIVDEKGTIRGIRSIQSNDNKGSEAIRTILVGTKAEGPSYDHNKAVSCYVPCSIIIKDHQIIIS